jgi:hypothetical protein
MELSRVFRPEIRKRLHLHQNDARVGALGFDASERALEVQPSAWRGEYREVRRLLPSPGP